MLLCSSSEPPPLTDGAVCPFFNSPPRDAKRPTDLGSQLLCDTQSQGRLARAGGSRQQQGSAGHLLLLDHVDDNAAGLTRLFLSHEARCCGERGSILGQAQALDVRVRRNTLGLQGKYGPKSKMHAFSRHRKDVGRQAQTPWTGATPRNTPRWRGVSRVGSTHAPIRSRIDMGTNH